MHRLCPALASALYTAALPFHLPAFVPDASASRSISLYTFASPCLTDPSGPNAVTLPQKSFPDLPVVPSPLKNKLPDTWPAPLPCLPMHCTVSTAHLLLTGALLRLGACLLLGPGAQLGPDMGTPVCTELSCAWSTVAENRTVPPPHPPVFLCSDLPRTMLSL